MDSIRFARPALLLVQNAQGIYARQ